MKKTTFAVLCIVLGILAVAAAGLAVLVFHSHETFKSKIEVKIDGVTEETLSVKELELNPSGTKEYEIELFCAAEGEFGVELIYTEKRDGGMKNFVRVTVLSGGDVAYEGGLSALLDEGERVSFDCTLAADKAVKVVIRYSMPAETGNEAQNTSAAFDVTVRIRKK
ncbi:MAG: hypothetical protein ACI4ST_06440 [Candidatus Gallimonas sp.]